MSDASSAARSSRVSGAISYVANGIGFGSCSNVELLLRLASAGWAFAAGGFTFLLSMMDYGPGLEGVIPIFVALGFVFGLLNARYWRLAALSAWGVVLMWALMAILLLPFGVASVTEAVSLDWAGELEKLATMVVLPVAASLLGSYVGMRLRTSVARRRRHEDVAA